MATSTPCRPWLISGELGREGQLSRKPTKSSLVGREIPVLSVYPAVYTVQHVSTGIHTNTWYALRRHALLNWGKTWSKVVIALRAYAPRISDSQQGSENEYHRTYHDLEQVAVRLNLRTP
jgi:hypothetical protein